MRLRTVGGITEWAQDRHSDVGWSCSAVPRLCGQLVEPGPSRARWVERMGWNEWDERFDVSPTISCHFQFGWRNRDRRASAVAEVGPDSRDGGRGGVCASASKMGDTGKAVRKCIELAVIDRDAGRA